MAEIRFIVDTDGTTVPHYTSLFAAEADLQGTNYITADQQPVIECRASSGAAETGTSQVLISGWTLDATHYLTIESTGAYRHPGYWDDTKYRLSITGNAYRVSQQYVRTVGLQIEEVHTGGRTAITISATDALIDKCIARTDAAGNSSNCVAVNGTYAPVIQNCLLHNRSSSGKGFTDVASSSGSGAKLYNNTFVGANDGDTAIEAEVGGGNVVDARNNLFYNFGTSASGDFAATSDYNATDRATIATGGANDRVSQTFTFVNAVSGDYHLDAADTGAKDQGADLSALGFSTDIDGATRSGTWDIGFDEVVVVSGGADVPLTATSGGGTQLTALLSVRKSLVASFNGSGGLTAFLALGKPLSSDSQGGGGDSGAALSAGKAISGTSSGTGTLTATLSALSSDALSGGVVGVGSLMASLSVGKPISGTFSGTGGASALTSLRKPLRGTSSGSSGGGAALVLAIDLAGRSIGISSASSVLSVIGGDSLAATIGGAGTFTASLAIGKSFNVVFVGAGVLGAGLISGTIGTEPHPLDVVVIQELFDVEVTQELFDLEVQ